MNKTAITHIDTHVRELVPGDGEKDQVPGLQVRYLYPFGPMILFRRRARSLYAGLVIGVVDQTAAVETSRARTTIAVRCSKHFNGKRKCTSM